VIPTRVPVQSEPARPFSATIRVVDDVTSLPVQGAVVARVADSLLIARSDLEELTTTGLEGVFTLHNTESVAVIHSAYQAKMLAASDVEKLVVSAGQATVRLVKPVAMTIHCLLPDGSPAAGCSVSISRVYGVNHKRIEASDTIALDSLRAPHMSTSDRNGVAVITGLARDMYQVQVELRGHCSSIAGSMESMVKAPSTLDVTMLPLHIARAVLPPEWKGSFSYMTRRSKGADVRGAASRLALRLVPELVNELWVVRTGVPSSESDAEEVFVASPLGHLGTTRVPYQPIFTSEPVQVAATRPPEKVFPVRIDVVDQHGAKVDTPLRVTLLGDKSGARASRKMPKGGELRLVKGRYSVKVNDIGREWFSEVTFSVPAQDGVVTLRSNEVLRECVVRLKPPQACLVGSWRLIIAMRGYKPLHRQMAGAGPVRMWLPLGEGVLRTRVPGLQDAELAIQVRADEEHPEFVPETLWL
jgi:hypothetical protein